MAVGAGVEKKIIVSAAVFVVTLAAVIALTRRLYSIDLPTCLSDVKPYAAGKVTEQGPGRYELQMLARMWKFEPAEVFVTPGSTVDVYLATADVTHGMQIVGTNVNLMAVPGAVNFSRVRFDRAGDYLVVCNEYCGIKHQNMAGVIHVTKNVPKPVPEPVAAAAVASPGQKLLEDNLCTACHSVDGSEGPGPTFKGLYESKVTLADGTVVTADEEYLAESITAPGVKIVKNFEDAMPPAELTPEQVHQIVEYLEALK